MQQNSSPASTRSADRRPRRDVELIVRRPAVDEREVLDGRRSTSTRGWWATLAGARKQPHPDGSAEPDAQLTLMNARAAR